MIKITDEVRKILRFGSGFTFIAQGYAFDSKHLKDTPRRAIANNGLAHVNVLQLCPSYNDIETKAWYGREDRKDEKTHITIPRCYDIEREGYNGRIAVGMSELEIEKKMSGVIEKSREWGDHIPIDVFYQDETVPTYSDILRERIPSYLSDPPCKQAVMRENNSSILDLQKISQELLY